ncbi:spore germination protein A3 precursor [Clostridium homopropionicum DSM 5847]|uniref:Spore germination protein A3 n=1 Tax=Clostridium homopropionicum DSM 5847 TaxID=1121318 RepID=A0A0L6Z790_9CLOT|nr:Ger(x)C family spore germination protein [Clostridium homopropionicum]KOA18824.1 spore germination protein A3 precursor [Clostridium homopropionicum DSM 5847]SFG89650.1 germination protein, Ger(x)C family [Clostridium homopropionicum]
MIKRQYKIISMVILSSLLVGCWDYEDINKKNIALSVGIDEKEGMIQLVAENAKLSSEIRGKSEQSQLTQDYQNLSQGKNFEDVRGEHEYTVPQSNFTGAMRAVVFSKSYAEKGIESYINRINFLIELRKSLLVVICNEPVKDFLKTEIKNDINISYAIEDTIKKLAKDGRSLFDTAQEVQAYIQNKDLGFVIPYVGIKDYAVEFQGLAVMKDSKMIGLINKKEIDGFIFLLLKNPIMNKTVYSDGDEKRQYAFQAKLKKRKVKTSYKDKKINIDVDLQINFSIKYQYKIEPLNKNKIKEVESEVSQMIYKEVMYAINKSQKDYKCDIFQFGKYFKANNPKDYRRINWNEEYPDANINVNVNTHLTNVNLRNVEQ